MTIAGERLLTKDEAAADLRDALDVVAELAPPEELRAATFNAAVQLCTARGRAVSPALAGLVGGDGRGLHSV